MADYRGTGGNSTRSAKRPISEQEGEAEKLLMDEEQLSRLANDLYVAGLYLNNHHLEMLSPSTGVNQYTSNVEELSSAYCSRQGIVIYQITKLMYNEEENTFEKLASVYSALNYFGGIVAMILKSNGRNTDLFLCTNTNGDGSIAGDLLSGNLQGQFSGCEIHRLSDERRDDLLDSCKVRSMTNSGLTVCSLSMIPSRREDEYHKDKEYSAQGIEKFIDAMSGHSYTLVMISQQISSDAMAQCMAGLETMYTSISPYAKETVSYGESESDSVNYAISTNINNSVSNSVSHSFGTTHTRSISEGRNKNHGTSYQLFGSNHNYGSGTSFSWSDSDGTSKGIATNRTDNEGYGRGDSQNIGSVSGFNKSVTLNRENKAVLNLLERIDEHMKRIKMSQTFGMWNSASYIIADDVATANMGISTLASLFSGDSAATPRAYYNQWDITNRNERDKVLTYLSNLMHPVISLTMLKEISDETGKISLHPICTEQVTPAIMISGKEIPILMGLPRKSVPGIVVSQMAEFGRNVPKVWKRNVKTPVECGNVYHMGKIEPTPVYLDLDTFASHLFICGASGSGKSNTTYHLIQRLIDNKVPFLVIEPAKGEYKIEFAGLKGINIFTAHESVHRQLLINPFEFPSRIHIREHLDNIIQVVSACWPLYGAMPGLLKKAFEQVYIEHGWDLDHSERLTVRGSKFPVFKDLAVTLERIIENEEFSNNAKNDYKGALLNRISSLCNGFEGEIFGRSAGIADKVLFNENTVIDLSSIGSDETRSLIMGILIIKLKNYRKIMAASPNSRLIHVTVLEEAHNILKRCSQETGTETANVQGAAVGSLCRCIAEMRSSGEGFMIIDQSPEAVDGTAIKNTAIKIAMRLPSRNDCEEIGVALSLNDNQIREISRLDTGVAAVYHAGWLDTLLVQMGTVWTGKYRVTTSPVLDKFVYIRIKGAVVQLLYKDWKERLYEDFFDDTKELLDFLCSGGTALKPLLPECKRKEILEDVLVFKEENDYLISNHDTDNAKILLFNFFFDFLKLHSLMRVFPLTGVSGEADCDAFSKKEERIVIRWEKDVRGAVKGYLYMPEKCEPIKAYIWPKDATSAEFFWDIYEGLMLCYAQNHTDIQYMNAYHYLRSTGFFTRKGK